VSSSTMAACHAAAHTTGRGRGETVQVRRVVMQCAWGTFSVLLFALYHGSHSHCYHARVLKGRHI
jgi:hypothetical protein